ncbi:hypothetical protein AVEN_213767-1 [Araneus ventricosus]|uniref:Uncharacterized protein n=1 Tax=Araneus ventricosus TaxID=182803 RepID=A0A4Y2T429_ARAVE|nr:hypothetical protein AVEN_213767-1 [Araneus ventricosus]
MLADVHKTKRLGSVFCAVLTEVQVREGVNSYTRWQPVMKLGFLIVLQESKQQRWSTERSSNQQRCQRKSCALILGQTGHSLAEFLPRGETISTRYDTAKTFRKLRAIQKTKAGMLSQALQCPLP